MSNGNPAYEELQARLAQAEALLVALRSGEVDAVISNSDVLLLSVQEAEAALREGEARYRSLFEHSLDAILLTATDGRILIANPAACRLFRWTVEELGQLREDALVDQTDPKTLAAWAERARAEQFQGELTYQRKDRSKFAGETSSATFGKQEGGKKTTIIRDITVRKRAEEALCQSQEQTRRQFLQLEAIYRTAPVGLGFLGVKLRFVRVNKLLAEMNGLPPQAHIGRSLREVMPGFAAKLEPICARVLQTGVPTFDLEIHGASKTHPGEERIWRTSYHPVKGRSRKVLGVNLVVDDITERKRAEQALMESEDRFRYLVDGVKDYAIFMLDPDGRVMTWNNGAERIKGYCAQEILGQHFSLFYEQGDIQVGKPAQELKVAAAAGRFEDEGWRVRKDGSRFWANVVTTALKDETGKLQGFAKLTWDMTERKRAEEALRSMQAELAHVTRVITMGELVASIAHEVNQPLAAVVTNANVCSRLLASPVLDLDEVREAVADIAEAGTRASEVTARIQALLQKRVAEKTQLDINEVIQEVLALTRSELRTHQVAVQTELRTGLPPVLGDRVQLQQVILNLIMNGIEAMTGVTNRPRVLVFRSWAHESGNVLVTVQDSGVGLDPQHMDQIFKTFFTTKPGGIGMGLSISRSIIEAHGGRLWTATTPGPGATFHFALPACSEGVP